MQVFGINYTKQYSPVASNTTTRIVIVMTLQNDFKEGDN